MTSGYDLNHWGYLWLNHEKGHILTLPDLYAYEIEGNDSAENTLLEYTAEEDSKQCVVIE